MFATVSATQPEPSSVRLTTESLRALAHPIRLRILGHLRMRGPATATTLATEFGLNSGATSYHLRQLAEHDLITEDHALGNRRERWWRAAHASTYFDRQDLTGDETGESYLRAIAQLYTEQIHGAIDRRVTMPEAWQSALSLSDWQLSLTAQQARDLTRDLADVLRRHRRHDPDSTAPAAAGEARVAVQFQVLPQPDADDIEGG